MSLLSSSKPHLSSDPDLPTRPVIRQSLPDACDWVGLDPDAWEAVVEQIGGLADRF